MSKINDDISQAVGELIGFVIGWAVCVSIAGGFFELGRLFASHVANEQHRDIAGLLSAISAIWMYERRNLDLRWDGLRDMIAALQRVP